MVPAMPTRSSSSRRRFRVGRSKSGLGLFALKAIKKGEFIAHYSGRIITNAEADRLWTKYLFEINSRWTVDGSGRRNTARYINHSCRPNAETDVKKHKIIITAIKNIQPGDEITYNYGRAYFNAFIKPIGCRCEACRKKRLEANRERRKAAVRKSGSRRTA
jgi:SET domain-containing protein